MTDMEKAVGFGGKAGDGAAVLAGFEILGDDLPDEIDRSVFGFFFGFHGCIRVDEENEGDQAEAGK